MPGVARNTYPSILFILREEADDSLRYMENIYWPKHHDYVEHNKRTFTAEI